MKTTELKSLQLKSYIMQNSNERGKTKKKKYTAVQRADTQNYKAVTNAKFIQQLFSGHRLHFFSAAYAHIALYIPGYSLMKPLTQPHQTQTRRNEKRESEFIST